VAIAEWAIGYTGRSIAVLVIWVGVWALTEGFLNIWAAFRLRGAHKQAAEFLEPPAPPAGPPPAPASSSAPPGS
jgi:hypothetical protein